MARAIDIAWAAGFLEGEGSFLVNGKRAYRVVASQVQREPLERLQRLFGGKISERKATSKYGWNQQASFAWYPSSRRSVEVMLTLYVLMSPRRQEQIAVALRHWRAHNHRYGQWKLTCANGHRWTADNYYDWQYAKRCKICWHSRQPQRTVYMREYRRKHPDRVAASIAKWREKNPDKVAAMKERSRIRERNRYWEKKHNGTASLF